MALNIYLIRHAETDFNKENSGFLQSDHIKLNSHGLIQLQYLKKKLSKIRFNKVYSSDYERTKQTTDFLFKEQQHLVVLDKRLREYVHGSVSPDSEEWKKKYKELFDLGYPREEIRPFGGENIWDLIKRIKSFLKDLEKMQGNIAIISSSGSNEVLINLSQKREKKDFLKIKQDNACINHLKYENGFWKILTINDSKHLDHLKPEIEYYEDSAKVNKKIKEFLGCDESFSPKEVLAIGALAKGRIGKYKRIFRRYLGTPLTLVSEIPLDKIKEDWKIVCIHEDYAEYCIGEIILNNVKYKINLIVPKDYKSFITKTETKIICGGRGEEINQKGASFVYNPIKDKFLLLNKADKWQGIVRGEINEKESPERVIERKIKQETGLNANEILYLKWGSVYHEGEKEFQEMNFITFVDSDKVKLSYEYSGHKWVKIDSFIKEIVWRDNKELLKRVLEKAIKKEIYFDKKERGE